MALSFKGFSLSAISNVLSTIAEVAPTETQAVVSVVPGGVGTDVQGDINLAEVSLAVLASIFQGLAAKQASAPATPTPAASTITGVMGQLS
jgi:hypothetical protein